MNITVLGTKKDVAKELKEATSFFANILMDPRMVRNLQIDIECVKKNDFEGECIDEDGIHNPRWFTIILKNQNLLDMIKVLAHEMVHVKQHAKNELKSGYMIPTRGGLKMMSKWHGKYWEPKKKEHAYYDSPWELEAYGKEVGLIQRWVDRKE